MVVLACVLAVAISIPAQAIGRSASEAARKPVANTRPAQPRVEVTSPVTGAVFPPSATIVFTVRVEPVTYSGPVKLYRDSTLIGEVSKPPFLFSITGLSEGRYEFRAEADPPNEGSRHSVRSEPVQIVVKTFAAPPPAQPDFDVRASRILPTEFPLPYQPFTIRFSYVRSGPPPEQPVHARLLLKDADGISLGPVDVALETETAAGSVSWQINGLSQGEYLASIHVDSEDAILELNEWNNHGEHRFRVGPLQ